MSGQTIIPPTIASKEHLNIKGHSTLTFLSLL